MAIETWLDERAVFVQLSLRDGDCRSMQQAVVDYSIALALQHRVSPAEALTAIAGQLPLGEAWARTRNELERVLTELGENRG